MSLTALTASRAIERGLLADLLRATSPGKIVTYAELTDACGLDVRGGGKHALRAARDDVLSDDRLVFEAIRNIGLRRMLAGELATEQPERRRRRVHRQTQIALREMNSVTLLELTDGERLQFNARLAHLGALATIATHRALKRVLSIASDSAELPVAETLAALKDIR